jgi:hypothetical protein
MGCYGLDTSGSGSGPVEGKCWTNSCVAAQLAASQGGLSSMELV